MYEDILNTENIFMDKLNFWYGEHLKDKILDVLYIEEIDQKLCTVVFIIKEDSKIEIIRTFKIGNKVELSIDLQCNTNCIGAIKQLVAYGGNYERFEIENN